MHLLHKHRLAARSERDHVAGPDGAASAGAAAGKAGDHDSNNRLRTATVKPVIADSSLSVSIGLLSYMRLMSSFDMVYPLQCKKQENGAGQAERDGKNNVSVSKHIDLYRTDCPGMRR